MSLDGNVFLFEIESFNPQQITTLSSTTHYFGGISFIAFVKCLNEHEPSFRFAVLAFFNSKETEKLINSMSVAVSYDGDDDEGDQEIVRNLYFTGEDSHACVYSLDVSLENFPNAPCQLLFSVHLCWPTLELLNWPGQSLTMWKDTVLRQSTDVLLKVGGAEFAAHKAILCVGSTVFAAMFNSGMQEAQTGNVVIEDIEPEPFSEFLRFLYTGYVTESETIDRLRDQLLNIADKYDVPQLKLLATHDANLMLRMGCELIFELGI